MEVFIPWKHLILWSAPSLVQTVISLFADEDSINDECDYPLPSHSHSPHLQRSSSEVDEAFQTAGRRVYWMALFHLCFSGLGVFVFIYFDKCSSFCLSFYPLSSVLDSVHFLGWNLNIHVLL